LCKRAMFGMWPYHATSVWTLCCLFFSTFQQTHFKNFRNLLLLMTPPPPPPSTHTHTHTLGCHCIRCSLRHRCATHGRRTGHGCSHIGQPVVRRASRSCSHNGDQQHFPLSNFQTFTLSLASNHADYAVLLASPLSVRHTSIPPGTNGNLCSIAIAATRITKSNNAPLLTFEIRIFLFAHSSPINR
jgi:hypothetical protein